MVLLGWAFQVILLFSLKIFRGVCGVHWCVYSLWELVLSCQCGFQRVFVSADFYPVPFLLSVFFEAPRWPWQHTPAVWDSEVKAGLLIETSLGRL